MTGDGAQRPLADAGGTGVTGRKVSPGSSVSRTSGASAGRASQRRAEGARRGPEPGLPHPVPCVLLSIPEHTEADGVFCFVFYKNHVSLFLNSLVWRWGTLPKHPRESPETQGISLEASQGSEEGHDRLFHSPSPAGDSDQAKSLDEGLRKPQPDALRSWGGGCSGCQCRSGSRDGDSPGAGVPGTAAPAGSLAGLDSGQVGPAPNLLLF